MNNFLMTSFFLTIISLQCFILVEIREKEEKKKRKQKRQLNEIGDSNYFSDSEITQDNYKDHE